MKTEDESNDQQYALVGYSPELNKFPGRDNAALGAAEPLTITSNDDETAFGTPRAHAP